MFETHLSVSQSLLRMSSKPSCPCRKCRNVSQADRAMSTEGGSIVVSSACSLSSSSASASHSAEVGLAEIMSSTMLSSVTSSQIGTLSSTDTYSSMVMLLPMSLASGKSSRGSSSSSSAVVSVWLTSSVILNPA